MDSVASGQSSGIHHGVLDQFNDGFTIRWDRVDPRSFSAPATFDEFRDANSLQETLYPFLQEVEDACGLSVAHFPTELAGLYNQILGHLQQNQFQPWSQGRGTVSFLRKVWKLGRVSRYSPLGLVSKAVKTRAQDWREQIWNEMYERLKDYKNLKGDCRVPWEYKVDPKLAKWVHNQRNRKSKSKLSLDRIQKLNDIGFVWVAKART